jgi:hypothetical protein
MNKYSTINHFCISLVYTIESQYMLYISQLGMIESFPVGLYESYDGGPVLSINTIDD